LPGPTTSVTSARVKALTPFSAVIRRPTLLVLPHSTRCGSRGQDSAVLRTPSRHPPDRDRDRRVLRSRRGYPERPSGGSPPGSVRMLDQFFGERPKLHAPDSVARSGSADVDQSGPGSASPTLHRLIRKGGAPRTAKGRWRFA
jgi:hypothetical protein